jgi:hypothetical protein
LDLGLQNSEGKKMTASFIIFWSFFFDSGTFFEMTNKMRNFEIKPKWRY